MKLNASEKFDKGFRKLPQDIQKQVDKKLALFLEYDFYYPSLRFKILKKYAREGVFELSVTKNYRIILQKIGNDEYYLLRVGTHDIVEKFKL